MEDELVCPKCRKTNGIQKFCIYCGNRILDDNQFELMMDNPEPYCLNCGKTVKKDKRKCECGYEFMDIKCPECSAENSYSNKFCTSCGKKLWKSNIYDYVYRQRLFEHHILNEQLPYSLHTTSLYQRSKKGVGRNPEFSINIYASSLPSLEKLDLKINENLHEISSR